jgi:hypothetical protein
VGLRIDFRRQQRLSVVRGRRHAALPHKLSKVFAGVATAILLYTAIGFLLFPVKRVAVQELTKIPGRTVTIRKIDFNPSIMSVARLRQKMC